MSKNEKDPTEPIRLKASQYPEVDKGTACTQSSFKVGKRAFLYIGMQGGRYKAMFKLQSSLPDAARLAEKEPDRFDVGTTAWVTARFTADKPMPKQLWQKWLDESYSLSVAPTGGSKSKTGRSGQEKKLAKKRTVAAKSVKKKTAKGKSVKKKTTKKSKKTAVKKSAKRK